MNPEDSGFRNAEFAESIAEQVIPVLEEQRFFALLDELFSPTDPAVASRKCEHSYASSIEILKTLSMDPEEIADILVGLKARGGCCDCEILYNVAEESRLRAESWKAEYRRLTSKD
ncbi:MAG: DUF2695 domain-containing protein [Terracidiphilus sp.]|jgi:hypothetical protein